MYYLTDFPNYQDEFEYTDNVVIAAGINDIARKHLTPEIICDVVLPRIRVTQFLQHYSTHHVP